MLKIMIIGLLFMVGIMGVEIVKRIFFEDGYEHSEWEIKYMQIYIENSFGRLCSKRDVTVMAKKLYKKMKRGIRHSYREEHFFIVWLEAIIGHIWMDLPSESCNMETIMIYLKRSIVKKDNDDDFDDWDDNGTLKLIDLEFEKLEEEKGLEYFPCERYRLFYELSGYESNDILKIFYHNWRNFCL